MSFEPQTSQSSTAQPTADPTRPLQVVLDWIRTYITTTRELLTQPSAFFRTHAQDRGIAGPIFYALVTHWIGTAVQFVWVTWLGGKILPTLAHWLNNLKQATQEISGRSIEDLDQLDSLGRHATSTLDPIKEKLGAWVLGAGPVLLDPVKELFSLLFLSGVIWIGARILISPGKEGAPSEIKYESALQIICYASAASILYVIPLVGPALSGFFGFVLATLGAREVWRIGTLRALVIAFFPNILLYAALGSMVGFVMLLIAKFLFSLIAF